MGRSKLPIRKLENATIDKLRSLNIDMASYKAYEIAVLCDIDLAIIMFSPSGRGHLCYS